MGLELVGAALLFHGLVLFMLGWLLLGKVDAKTAGLTALLGGLVGFLVGLYLLPTELAPPATLLLVFSVLFIVTSAHLVYGFDLKGLGFICAFWAVADFLYAGYFAAKGLLVITTFCVLWFALFVLFVLTLLTGKAEYAKPTAYFCLFCSFVTLLVPGFLLTIGVALP